MNVVHSAAAGLRQTPAATQRLSSYLKSCLVAFQEWRERGRSQAELSSLSDSALMDMGIARGEIEFLITHPDKRGVRSCG